MHGLYLLWWVQEKEMSPALVAAMLAAGDLALIGLELPTGWFADRFGHRASLIIGSFVQVLGMLWCWLGDGVSGLLAASVLVALGDAFRSGADQALLYRTCVALDREEEFLKIQARTEAIALAALVVLVLVGGLIVRQRGFVLGWVAEATVCAIGVAIACAMVEPPSDHHRRADERPAPSTAPVPYARLVAALMPAAILGGVASATAFLAQTLPWNNPASVTILVAGLTAAEAAGSAAASRVRSATQRVQMQLLAFGAIVFGIAITTPALSIAAVALAFLAGVAQPLRAAATQRLAPDEARARVASAASACDMIVSSIMLPLAGLRRSRG
jgi:MFS family permease